MSSRAGEEKWTNESGWRRVAPLTWWKPPDVQQQVHCDISSAPSRFGEDAETSTTSRVRAPHCANCVGVGEHRDRILVSPAVFFQPTLEGFQLLPFRNRSVISFIPLLGQARVAGAAFSAAQARLVRQSASCCSDRFIMLTIWFGIAMRFSRSPASRNRADWRSLHAHVGVRLEVIYLSLVHIGLTFLRLWLENHARGERFRWQFFSAHPETGRRDRDVTDTLVAFPDHVRCNHDQGARRPVLARSHLPVLSLRNAAATESIELVFASRAALVP